jgi:hypothetical protein
MSESAGDVGCHSLVILLTEGNDVCFHTVDDQHGSIADFIILEDHSDPVEVRRSDFDENGWTLFIGHAEKCPMLLIDLEGTREDLVVGVPDTHRSIFDVFRPVWNRLE